MAPKIKKTQQEEQVNNSTINYTLCIPTTIINGSNAKNLQQVTGILYQIAKAASIYNVGEIVIMDTFKEFEEPVDLTQVVVGDDGKKKIKFDDLEKKQEIKESINKEVSEEAMIIATILQYFVTPPYLIKSIFRSKFFKNFQYAKNYPKLTTLPFMNDSTDAKYREGLTVQMGRVTKTTKSIHKPTKKPQPLKTTKYVNIGYNKYLELDHQQVPTNVRVTVNTDSKKVVSPVEAYGEGRVGAKSSYGYHVRIAKKFSSIFTESSYADGYSNSIWINSGEFFGNSRIPEFQEFKKPKEDKDMNYLLVVCKWLDIENAFKQDSLNLKDVDSAKEFFDYEVKIPLGTRIEDGALIGLTKMAL